MTWYSFVQITCGTTKHLKSAELHRGGISEKAGLFLYREYNWDVSYNLIISSCGQALPT